MAKRQRNSAKGVELEVGTKRGRLTIIEEVDRYVYPRGTSCRCYKCICECGRECYATADTLKRGVEPSCGCALQKRVGDKVGCLTLIEEHEKRCGERIFTVQCDCGNKEIRGLKWLKTHKECYNCSRKGHLDIYDLPNEVWKDIEGYEGLYQVSNMGRVKSLPKYRKTIYEYISKPMILSPRARGKKGYLAVALKKGNKVKQLAIHRLVAFAFCPNPNSYIEVNHKDEDKTNNRADNLEWCSRSYNVNYGLANEKRAEKSRIAVEIIDAEGNTIRQFKSFRECAEYIGADPASVTHAIKRNGTLYGYRLKKIV